MNGNGGIDVTAAQWRAPLIRLTQIEDMEGENAEVWIDPTLIALVVHSWGAISSPAESDMSERKWGPLTRCTIVWTAMGSNLCVVESPAQVAMLRNRALGHDEKPRSA